MRVLFILWESFGNNDVIEELDRRGYEVVLYKFNRKMEDYRDPRDREKLIGALDEQEYDFVFSFDFFPLVSVACAVKKVRYVAWVYDSVLFSIHHYTIASPYNYIFLFDKTDYFELKQKGLTNVYYLPLAAPVERYDSYIMSDEVREVYEAPISFVGSTYSENRHGIYKRMCQLDDYTRGYVDGCMQAQKNIYGNFILENMLAAPDILKNIKAAIGMEKDPDLYMGYERCITYPIFAKYVTVMERQEILSMLSEKYKVALYTLKRTPSLPKTDNRGIAGTKKEVCFIYRASKINLNITLKTIRSGIPLRAFEIMGSGGFLMTNYQTDFLDFFEPGVDFTYYNSYEDLMEKVEYYLSHDKEREEIAKNGYEKVKEYHNYHVRIGVILDILDNDKVKAV